MTVGDRQSILDVEKLLNAIAHLKHQHTLKSLDLNYTLTEYSGKVASIAISPDSEMLVSGSTDKTIRMWQIAYLTNGI